MWHFYARKLLRFSKPTVTVALTTSVHVMCVNAGQTLGSPVPCIRRAWHQSWLPRNGVRGAPLSCIWLQPPNGGIQLLAIASLNRLTLTLSLSTLHYACWYDEITGNQDPKTPRLVLMLILCVSLICLAATLIRHQYSTH